MVIYRVDNSSIMEYTSSHVPSSLAVVVEVGEDDDDDDDGVADSSTATLFFILFSFCFSTTAIYFARNVAALTAKSSSRLLLLRAVAVVALPPFVVVVVVVVVGVSRVGLDTSPIFFINTRRWAFFINHIAGGSTSSTFGECIELSLGTVSYPSAINDAE